MNQNQNTLRGGNISTCPPATCEAPKEAPIPHEVRMMNDLLDQVDKSLSVLENRISSILTPPLPTGANPAGKDDCVSRSGLAEYLAQNNSKIHRIIAFIESIERRVEV